VADGDPEGVLVRDTGTAHLVSDFNMVTNKDGTAADRKLTTGTRGWCVTRVVGKITRRIKLWRKEVIFTKQVDQVTKDDWRIIVRVGLNRRAGNGTGN
jgi:hypothetical protein